MFFRVLSKSILSTAVSFLIAGATAHAAVWETKKQWNDEAETAYRLWVQTNWNKNYFLKDGPLKNMIMDCADVVYAMRVIYAAEHGLPFVMKDPTTRAGTPITNEMTRWDSRPEGERLRPFLNLIFGVGSTMSLPADTYPTAISRATLGSGSIILTDKDKHHSWTIQNFSKTGIPYLLFGSRPARTLLYERNDYPSVGFVFPNGIRPETNAGFRNFRQPADIGKPVHEAQGYSLEQYSIPTNGGWMRAVQKRMQQVAETHEQRVVRLYNEACIGARERVDIVRAAIKLDQSIGSRCMSAAEYDDQSTPSRDQRLKDAFNDLSLSFKNAMGNGGLSVGARKLVESALNARASAADPDASCLVEIAPGKKLALGQIFGYSMANTLSNNPHDTLEMRWGLAKGPSAKASSCPVY